MDAHDQLLSDLRTGLRQFEARVEVDAVRHAMALQFRWLVGIILTGMATIAAAILAG